MNFRKTKFRDLHFIKMVVTKIPLVRSGKYKNCPACGQHFECNLIFNKYFVQVQSRDAFCEFFTKTNQQILFKMFFYIPTISSGLIASILIFSSAFNCFLLQFRHRSNVTIVEFNSLLGRIYNPYKQEILNIILKKHLLWIHTFLFHSLFLNRTMPSGQFPKHLQEPIFS